MWSDPPQGGCCRAEQRREAAEHLEGRWTRRPVVPQEVSWTRHGNVKPFRSWGFLNGMQMRRFKIFLRMVTSLISQFVTGCFSGSRLYWLLKWCRERKAFKTGFLSSCILRAFNNWCCSALSATLFLSLLCQPVQTMGRPHRQPRAAVRAAHVAPAATHLFYRESHCRGHQRGCYGLGGQPVLLQLGHAALGCLLASVVVPQSCSLRFECAEPALGIRKG